MAPGQRVVLVIAGSDSSGGAGMQRDLLALAQHGVRARSAITAVTAQSNREVRAVHPVPAQVVAAQIQCALEEGVDAVKIGMLCNADTVRAVAEALAECRNPIVIDPVLSSSSGKALLDLAGREALLQLLSPHAALLTPNIPEAAALLQAADPSASAMAELSRCPVLLKGGHAQGPTSTDWLFDGTTLSSLQGPRIATQMRGTGCALSSAIAAQLAGGSSLHAACSAAKDYVASLLRASVSVAESSVR